MAFSGERSESAATHCSAAAVLRAPRDERGRGCWLHTPREAVRRYPGRFPPEDPWGSPTASVKARTRRRAKARGDDGRRWFVRGSGESGQCPWLRRSREWGLQVPMRGPTEEAGRRERQNVSRNGLREGEDRDDGDGAIVPSELALALGALARFLGVRPRTPRRGLGLAQITPPAARRGTAPALGRRPNDMEFSGERSESAATTG
jgi:hypothetical protein